MDNYTADEHRALDKHFEDMYSKMTLDQITVTASRATVNGRTDEWYKHQITMIGAEIIKLHHAGIQFPSIAADGISNVPYHIVRDIRSEHEILLNNVKKLISQGSDSRSGMHRQDFDCSMREYADSIIQLGMNANRDWWDSVKDARCPLEILIEQREKEHNAAITENTKFDNAREVKRALDTLSPEHRTLIEGLL